MREEFFHRPGGEEYWSESYYLDFVGEDVQGHARIGFYPNRGRASLWVYVFDGEDVYGIRDEEIPPAATHGLTVRRDSWEFAMLPDEVGTEWTVEFEGRTKRYASPDGVLSGNGEAAHLSLRLTTTGRHDPYLFSEGPYWGDGDDSDRYEQATTVEGEVTIDGRETEFAGPGERDHSWGPRRWAGDTEWLWISGAFQDGTAYNHVSAWAAGTDERVINGFWFDDGEHRPLTGAEVAAAPAFGPETARDWMAGDAPTIELAFEWDGGETAIEAEPFATTPIDWIDEDQGRHGVLNRSVSRQERDGVSGTGFVENMTQLPL